MTLTMTLSTMKMAGLPITVCTIPWQESTNGLVPRRLQLSHRKHQKLHLLSSSVIEWTQMDIGQTEEDGGGDEEEYSDTCLGGYALVVSFSPRVVALTFQSRSSRSTLRWDEII